MWGLGTLLSVLGTVLVRRYAVPLRLFGLDCDGEEVLMMGTDQRDLLVPKLAERCAGGQRGRRVPRP